MGGVGAKGGVVVAEAVVGPPGFRILILASKQQWAGVCSCPGACAVEGLCGSSFDGAGGGVDGFFGYASAETIIGVAVAHIRFVGGGKSDGLFAAGVVEVVDVGC